LRAAWLVVKGKGTGGAIDGVGETDTIDHFVVVPRQDNTAVVILVTCAAENYEDAKESLGNALTTLRLTGSQTERQRGAKDKPSSTAIAPFTDADVQRIAALPAAEQVEEVRKELVRRNPGFDGKMEHKIKGGVVTEIRIVTDKVTDIAPIRVWSALRVLDCHGTWGNGLKADLTPLEGMNLAGLTHLNLSDTKVTDARMVSLKDCKDLRYLNLANTKVTDKGLANFKDCKNLTKLFLDSTQVADAGLVDLARLDKLIELNLANTKVTANGVEGLAKALPKCKITWDGGVVEPR
jgi:hypothetical protein